jgi:HD-GYP domain-containing protein (c-di-GMP phosphodiesterase class II)/fumarate reductase subunit D
MSPEPARPRRRYPLHIHLSALFSALVLATGIAIAWLGYSEARDLTLKATDDVFGHVGRETRSALEGALRPVASFADLLALQPLARARTLDQRLEALPLMRQAFAGHAPIAAAYAGYDDGSFFLVRPLRSDAERAFFEAPAGTALYVQSIEVGPGEARAVTHLYFDASLRELGRRSPGVYGFDARTRPWYRLATRPGERVLTEPYVFFSTGAPGMTVAVRTGAASVVGVDVTLHQVSELLAGLRTLPGMKIVLFGDDRRILAHADLAREMVRRDGDRVALATLDEYGEPVLAQMHPVRADADRGAGRTLDADGASWKAVVLPVPTVRGTLSLGIAVPLDALLADARAVRMRGLLAALAILLVAIPLTWWIAHRVGRALRALTGEAQDIRAFRFDGPAAPPSIVLEVDQLAGAMAMMRDTIRNFLDIAGSLAAETNFRRLLDRVVAETSATTHAAGGLVYLFEAERGVLAPASAAHADGRSIDVSASELPVDAAAPVAEAFRSGKTVVASGAAYDFVASLWRGEAVSVVAIPLRDRNRDTVGVLALFVRGGERPSAARLAFAEALSGTAAVAIETQRLLEARKALLDAFIRLVAGAIDAKSPYTGGHCQRVPELTLMLARAACEAREGPFSYFALSEEEWEALQIASWLHDCGKVTTPEYVVDKATKLETICDRIHEVRMRFEVLKRDAEIGYWKRVADGGDRAALRGMLEAEWRALDADFAFVAECNEGGEFMAPERVARLKAIAARTWTRTLDDRIGIAQEERKRKERSPAAPLPATESLLADKPEHVIERRPEERMDEGNRWGFRVKTPELLYNRGELYNLSVGRGTLSEEERYKINEHMIQTIIMLSALPFPRHLRRVPEIAGGHHEKMDGTGYPKRLKREDMSPVARMMAIADIFEALTAADRPYKKAKTLSEAIKIMGFMRKDQHVDPELFELFLTSGVYREYAERFLAPEQIDAVDVAAYVGGR